MKRTIFILSAMTMLAAVSCTKEITNETNGSATGADLYPMTFTANSQQTKAELVDGKFIHWESGDQINVFDNTETVYDRFETSDKGSQATFSGMAGKAEGYYALYPYQSDASMTEGAIIATFPSEQTAVAGSFDPKAFIAVAQSDNEGNFSFKNVAALVQFTMPKGENATSATLTANADNEKLCGRVKITFDEDGNPSATANGTMTNAVTLNGNLEGGKTYYFVVRPGIAFSKGLTISIDGKKYRSSSAASEEKLVSNSVMALPAFTFKEGMPKDLYTAYEHGFDLQIGGHKFDKATYGDATLITAKVTMEASGIYFLNPGVEQKLATNIGKLAVIGRYADNKSSLYRDSHCNVKATSTDNEYLLIANAEYKLTADLTSTNGLFQVSNEGSFDSFILDNVKLVVPSTGSKRLINCGSTNNRVISNLIVVNSDILVSEGVTNMIYSESAVDMSVVKFNNNVVYGVNDITNYRAIYRKSSGISSLQMNNNTFVNLYTGSGYVYATTIQVPAPIDGNLFYIPSWSKINSYHSVVCPKSTYDAQKNDESYKESAMTLFTTNNHAYYGGTTPGKQMRCLYGSGKRYPKELSTAPFTADQIAAGNFALPEGTTYGAKR